jgi:hypothetical protein
LATGLSPPLPYICERRCRIRSPAFAQSGYREILSLKGQHCSFPLSPTS